MTDATMTSNDIPSAAAAGDDPAQPPVPAAIGRIAQGLGWFSIALGLSEALFPLATGRSIGMPGRSTLLRTYGAREIGAGVGLLTAKDPTPWLWGRVAGDALDITTLAVELVNSRSGVRSIFGTSSRRKTALALAVVAGVTALDVACARAATVARNRPAPPDYGDRVGMPQSPDAMRGLAWSTGFRMPADMRVPDALRPFPAP